MPRAAIPPRITPPATFPQPSAAAAAAVRISPSIRAWCFADGRHCLLAPEPRAKPFIEVAIQGFAGHTLLSIEAMKRMKQIPSLVPAHRGRRCSSSEDCKPSNSASRVNY